MSRVDFEDLESINTPVTVETRQSRVPRCDCHKGTGQGESGKAGKCLFRRNKPPESSIVLPRNGQALREVHCFLYSLISSIFWWTLTSLNVETGGMRLAIKTTTSILQNHRLRLYRACYRHPVEQHFGFYLGYMYPRLLRWHDAIKEVYNISSCENSCRHRW
jgi:hypothetical protein